MRFGYTLAQCNTMLPLVRAISQEVTERRSVRRRLVRERQKLETASTPEGLTVALGDLESQIYEQEDAIVDACKELESYGLTVLRVNPLVVHFPGKTRDGEVVFCWQEDDPSIAHGHPNGQEREPRYPLKLKSA